MRACASGKTRTCKPGWSKPAGRPPDTAPQRPSPALPGASTHLGTHARGTVMVTAGDRQTATWLTVWLAARSVTWGHGEGEPTSAGPCGDHRLCQEVEQPDRRSEPKPPRRQVCPRRGPPGSCRRGRCRDLAAPAMPADHGRAARRRGRWRVPGRRSTGVPCRAAGRPGRRRAMPWQSRIAVTAPEPRPNGWQACAAAGRRQADDLPLGRCRNPPARPRRAAGDLIALQHPHGLETRDRGLRQRQLLPRVQPDDLLITRAAPGYWPGPGGGARARGRAGAAGGGDRQASAGG